MPLTISTNNKSSNDNTMQLKMSFHSEKSIQMVLFLDDLSYDDLKTISEKETFHR